MEARQRALVAALDDMLGWLESGGAKQPTFSSSRCSGNPVCSLVSTFLCFLTLLCLLAPSGAGQVAIFDATNSTVSRRQFLVRRESSDLIAFVMFTAAGHG